MRGVLGSKSMSGVFKSSYGGTVLLQVVKYRYRQIMGRKCPNYVIGGLDLSTDPTLAMTKILIIQCKKLLSFVKWLYDI